MLFLKKHLNFIIALCLAIIIHIALFIFVYFVKPKNIINNSFIELTIIKKKRFSTIKKIIKPKTKPNRKKQQPIKKDFSVRDTLLFADSSKILVSDSIKMLTEIDSFLFANPNITVLKIDAKEKLKNYIEKNSDLEITKRKISKTMNDYYKAKYPTPPHKFGNKGTGNLINIPIDEIIKLFK
jgi:hypothetical protein